MRSLSRVNPAFLFILYNYLPLAFELIIPHTIPYRFYSAAALHAMQSAVIPTAIPSVRLSVCLSLCHTLVPYPDE